MLPAQAPYPPCLDSPSKGEDSELTRNMLGWRRYGAS